MIANINIFLDGMKTAFYTSIIGMIFGLVIKFVQSGIERAHEADVKKNLAAVDDTSQKILAAIQANDLSELRGLAEALRDFAPAVRELSEQLKAQTETFDAMKTHLERMETSLAAAEKNSADLLSETKIFQQKSLDNDDKQSQILSDNTAQIVAMKKSFDEFLQTMSDKFSDSIIDALNKTIQDFNDNLTGSLATISSSSTPLLPNLSSGNANTKIS